MPANCRYQGPEVCLASMCNFQSAQSHCPIRLPHSAAIAKSNYNMETNIQAYEDKIFTLHSQPASRRVGPQVIVGNAMRLPRHGGHVTGTAPTAGTEQMSWISGCILRLSTLRRANTPLCTLAAAMPPKLICHVTEPQQEKKSAISSRTPSHGFQRDDFGTHRQLLEIRAQLEKSCRGTQCCCEEAKD